MSKKKIVIALGGNALGNTPDEQAKALEITANSIVDLIEEGHDVIVSHGNGPQVGMISLAFENAKTISKKLPTMPLFLSGAMSQGYIGLDMQKSIKNVLMERKINKNVVSLITQTIVDEKDPSFQNPTKPIGSFYSEEEAKKLAESNGWTVGEDAGRGWRRMVPSPMPIDIVEKDIIASLVSQNNVVISGGGGGIPTIKKGNKLQSVDAVIDKDFTSEKIAELVDADILVIATTVQYVSVNFNTPEAYPIKKPSIKLLKELLDKGEYPPGSMGPKVRSAIKFAEVSADKISIITSLDKVKEAILDGKGTIITQKNQ